VTRDLPINLLDKLFFYVRTPDGYDSEIDDFDWVVADAVANYRRGWEILEGEKLVQIDEDDSSNFCVRFTPKGLKLAKERNISDKVAAKVEEKIKAETAAVESVVYADNPFWGML
jgi:hypothetical protein